MRHPGLFLVFVVLGVAHAVTTRTVPCSQKGMWLDVAVAIDYSRNMGVNGIVQAVSDVSSIFLGSAISQDIGQYTRVAIVNHTQTAHPLENEIFDIIPVKTAEKAGYITSGLHAAAASLSSGRISGKRNNVPQVVMLFVSEYSSTINFEAVDQANLVKSNGITIIVVDNSRAQNIHGLNEIATPGMVFLGNDTLLITKVQDALCTANTFCKSGWTQVSDSFPNGINKQGECIKTGKTNDLRRADAVTNCNSLRGYLVSEFDQAKHDFVYAMVGNTTNRVSDPAYFIGLTWTTDGGFHWDQIPGQVSIPYSIHDWSDWYDIEGVDYFDSLNSNVYVRTDSKSIGWYPFASGTAYAVCQINTCDTDNYCS